MPHTRTQISPSVARACDLHRWTAYNSNFSVPGRWSCLPVIAAACWCHPQYPGKNEGEVNFWIRECIQACSDESGRRNMQLRDKSIRTFPALPASPLCMPPTILTFDPLLCAWPSSVCSAQSRGRSSVVLYDTPRWKGFCVTAIPYRNS